MRVSEKPAGDSNREQQTMTTRMTVLASGSSGNCTLLEMPGFGALLDLGLGPRRLSKRLADCGASWNSVRAALLTHIHCDHWNEATLSKLLHSQIPLYCHPEHADHLRRHSVMFRRLAESDLVCTYRANDCWQLTDGVTCRALPVSHDSGETFGFRIEVGANLFETGWSLGYAADLGTWDDELVESLANVDVIALEFNHDVGLQKSSGRPPHLIARVLGSEGHLSNEQGAALLDAVLKISRSSKLRHVVQLHLSRDCNRPSLAQQAARRTIGTLPQAPQLHTASQDYATVICDVAAVAVR